MASNWKTVRGFINSILGDYADYKAEKAKQSGGKKCNAGCIEEYALWDKSTMQYD